MVDGYVERVVDYLADQRFEVDWGAIVGRDLQLVEQVTDRMNYGWAAPRGAGLGGLVGALIGWIFGLLNWLQPLIAGLVPACYGLIFGAVVGALVGLLLYALQRGRRDFSAVTSLQPRQYDIVADVAVADHALQLLGAQTNERG
ncbi:MAG: general stress protein [Mycobacterium sp.]